jgi:hypothetical protein
MIGHRAAVALAAAKGARGRFGQSQALEDPKNAVASIKALAAQHALGPRDWLRHRHSARLRSLGTIGFEGRFDYAAIGTVSNVAEHREPCESRGSCTVLGARGRRKRGPSLAQHRQARTRLDKGRPRFCGALSQQDDLV